MTRRNPFTINPIRKKEEFIGRKNLISDVKNSLSRQECCHIVGERKSGKTSFLYRMAEEFKKGDMKFVFLDMQRFRPYGPEEILGKIAHCIDADLPEKEMGYREFENFISDKKVILAFDEILAIVKNERIDSDFFDFLRAISSNFDVVFLTTHREGLYEITANVSSPFFNYFRNFHLGYFTKEESKELIKKGGEEFLNEYEKWIIKKAYYHPFLLQLVCLTLFEHCEEDKESMFSNAEKEVYETLEDHFMYWYEKSSEKEKEILRKIVSREEEVSKDEEKVAQCLEKRLLVYERNDRYHLVSPFFKIQRIEQRSLRGLGKPENIVMKTVVFLLGIISLIFIAISSQRVLTPPRDLYVGVISSLMAILVSVILIKEVRR